MNYRQMAVRIWIIVSTVIYIGLTYNDTVYAFPIIMWALFGFFSSNLLQIFSCTLVIVSWFYLLITSFVSKKLKQTFVILALLILIAYDGFHIWKMLGNPDMLDRNQPLVVLSSIFSVSAAGLIIRLTWLYRA